MVSPAQLASPLLGGPDGRHAGPARLRSAPGLLSMALLGISILIGLSRQYTCFRDGWGYPGAAHRLCASPIANALAGQTYPNLPGRSSGALEAFTPGNSWLVDLVSIGGADVATGMAFLLLINVLAVGVLGVALIVAAPRSSWVAAAFLSPVIMFSLGQGLEPVAVACAAVAVLLVTRQTASGLPRVLLAGILLGVAAAISPVALLAPVALVVWAFGTKRPGMRADALTVIGIKAVVLGVFVIADGSLLTRLRAWYAEPVDRGSLVAVLVGNEVGNPLLLGPLSLVLWAVATVAAAQLLSVARPRPGLPVYLTVFYALAVLLLPAAPTTLALWLVPVAAMTVHRLWVQVAWMLAEAAFFIAVNLRDAAATQDKVGLSEGWLDIFTILRIVAVLCVLLAALWPRPRVHSEGASAQAAQDQTEGQAAQNRAEGRAAPDQAEDGEAVAGRAGGDQAATDQAEHGAAMVGRGPTEQTVHDTAVHDQGVRGQGEPVQGAAAASATPFVRPPRRTPEPPPGPEHSAPDVIPPTFPDDPLDTPDARH